MNSEPPLGSGKAPVCLRSGVATLLVATSLQTLGSKLTLYMYPLHCEECHSQSLPTCQLKLEETPQLHLLGHLWREKPHSSRAQTLEYPPGVDQ
eukprot:6492641-Amphidinium_carterae.1